MPVRQPLKVFWISFFVLSLELAFIRLIPSEIKSISYFTNLLLFSSFFGLGLGCIVAGTSSKRWLLPAGTFLLFLIVAVSRGIVIYQTGTTVHYWLQADHSSEPFMQLPLYMAAIVVFVLASIPFVALGQELACAMDALERLEAYSWDIRGSLTGTIAFAALAYVGLPPWLWICGVLVAFALLFVPDWTRRLPYFAAGACFLLFSTGPYSRKWSPYYLVQYSATADYISVWVNSSFHQEAVNFDSNDPKYSPFARKMFEKFSTPYETYRAHHGGMGPRKVLILGAGTGNDVNVALRNGVKDITAVEIDPVIAGIGKVHNAMQPYANPAVRLRIDDARHFLWNSAERYDLIVFGTLDSQTLLSGQANLRLDNYVYTVECFRNVRDVLEDGGMVAAYYSVFRPWFYWRIYATVRGAFPGEMQMVRFDDNYLFNTVIMGGKGVANWASEPTVDAAAGHEVPSTDDWPYIYLERPTIAPLYVTVFFFVASMIVGVFLLLRRLHPGEGRFLNLFFLGLGFTLLQAAAIVRLALVFGTTWIVSAVVFASTLLTIFLANLSVSRGRAPSLGASWAGLLAMLLANYFMHVDLLFAVPVAIRVLASVILIGTPVFFAGICFSRLFSGQKETGLPLGINLVGAMAGGLIEYLSMVIGMRNIWLVIVVVYFAAFLATARRPLSTAAAT